MAFDTRTMTLLGFALVFAGVFIVVASRFLQKRHSAHGGLVFVGPVPVAFGSHYENPIMKWFWYAATAIFLAALAWLMLKK